jgi:hypothetical protein
MSSKESNPKVDEKRLFVFINYFSYLELYFELLVTLTIILSLLVSAK